MNVWLNLPHKNLIHNPRPCTIEPVNRCGSNCQGHQAEIWLVPVTTLSKLGARYVYVTLTHTSASLRRCVGTMSAVLRAIGGLFLFSVIAVLVFAASGPLVAAVSPPKRKLSQATHTAHFAAATSFPPPPPAAATSLAATTTTTTTPPPPPLICGDGKCEFPETVDNCFADCPGITTPPQCGEEAHSDPQGMAVVDGRGHSKQSAAECCEACAEHARKHPKKPCNSWVFCYMKPQCWSLDTGNKHLFGECALLAAETHPTAHTHTALMHSATSGFIRDLLHSRTIVSGGTKTPKWHT